jgi:hypothetical protein
VCVCAPVDDVCLHRSRSWLVASVDWRSVFIFIFIFFKQLVVGLGFDTCKGVYEIWGRFNNALVHQCVFRIN